MATSPDMLIRGVIARAHLQLLAPEVVCDFPGGGRRLVQKASGYAATVVSGVATMRSGEATGALPGKLLRA